MGPLGHPSASIKDREKNSLPSPTVSQLGVAAGSGFARPRASRAEGDQAEAAVLSRSRSTAAAAAAILYVERHDR